MLDFKKILADNGALSIPMEESILTALAHLEHPQEEIEKLDIFLCHSHISMDFFEKMAAIIAGTYNPELVLSMKKCLHQLRKDESAFVNMVLSFVLHPKGKYRVVGRELWDEYHLETSVFDVLSLPENEQIVFVVFMLQDFGNPDRRLPKVLPLFSSPSAKVRHVLLNQMIPYANQYMGHVMAAIEKMRLDTVETRRLKKYVGERAVMVRKRRGLKELSPEYTQYRYYREACRMETVKLQQQLNWMKCEVEEPCMNMCVKHVLARGGGWRLENGKTHHLDTFRYSVPSRLMDQSMTPLEKEKWMTDLLKDWDVTEGNH